MERVADEAPGFKGVLPKELPGQTLRAHVGKRGPGY